MRPVLQTLMTLLLVMLADARPTAAGEINHVVLCWLKDPGNAEHRQQIIEGTWGLRDIPGVLEVRVGRVVTSERDIVDDSFDVGLVMTFATTGDMDAYIGHPTHQRILKEVLLPVVDRIRVYDFAAE